MGNEVPSFVVCSGIGWKVGASFIGCTVNSAESWRRSASVSVMVKVSVSLPYQSVCGG